MTTATNSGSESLGKADVVMRMATMSDFDTVWQIIQEAKQLMARTGRTQWNANYPAEFHIRKDLESSNACVLELHGRIAAYGVVALNGEEAYEHLECGAWQTSGDYYVGHRLAVAASFRGNGVAGMFLGKVAEKCRRTGVGSIRVDTNFDNTGMLSVLTKLDFVPCGRVCYPVNGERLVYEKVISG